MKKEIETSLAVVAFSIFVVIVFWILGKGRQNRGPLGDDLTVYRTERILWSFCILPLILALRHELFLKYLYGLVGFAVIEFIWRTVANHNDENLRFRGSFPFTMFINGMLGVGIVVVSWYLVATELYIGTCKYLQKEIFGR